MRSRRHGCSVRAFGLCFFKVVEYILCGGRRAFAMRPAQNGVLAFCADSLSGMYLLTIPCFAPLNCFATYFFIAYYSRTLRRCSLACLGDSSCSFINLQYREYAEISVMSPFLRSTCQYFATAEVTILPRTQVYDIVGAQELYTIECVGIFNLT